MMEFDFYCVYVFSKVISLFIPFYLFFLSLAFWDCEALWTTNIVLNCAI